MPSTILNNQSGGQLILSGAFWSGQNPRPQGGIQLKAGGNNSGFIYIGLSGGMTVNSGGLNSSGFSNSSGLLDGMELGPGDAYFVPKIACPSLSGIYNIFAQCDAAVSGLGRVYAEVL